MATGSSYDFRATKAVEERCGRLIGTLDGDGPFVALVGKNVRFTWNDDLSARSKVHILTGFETALYHRDLPPEARPEQQVLIELRYAAWKAGKGDAWMDAVLDEALSRIVVGDKGRMSLRRIDLELVAGVMERRGPIFEDYVRLATAIDSYRAGQLTFDDAERMVRDEIGAEGKDDDTEPAFAGMGR